MSDVSRWYDEMYPSVEPRPVPLTSDAYTNAVSAGMQQFALDMERQMSAVSGVYEVLQGRAKPQVAQGRAKP